MLHLVDDGLLDVFGVVPVGQVQQDREPGGALDERADRALVAGAGDEVALPVAGDRPVLRLGRLAICSGLQCLRNPAGISAHNGVPSAALRGLGRLSRPAAFCWARQGSQSPVPGFLLRSISRLTVPGSRPGSRAMARIESPGRSRSAIGMRSS